MPWRAAPTILSFLYCSATDFENRCVLLFLITVIGDSREVFFRDDRTVFAAAMLCKRACDEFHRMLVRDLDATDPLHLSFCSPLANYSALRRARSQDGRMSLANDVSAQESEDMVLFALKLLHDVLQYSKRKLRDFNHTRPAKADFANSPVSQEGKMAPSEHDEKIFSAEEDFKCALAKELGYVRGFANSRHAHRYHVELTICTLDLWLCSESVDYAMKLLRRQNFPRSCAMAAAVACVATVEFSEPLPGVSYSWHRDDPFQMSTVSLN